MNFLKSMFISNYMMLATASSGYSGWMLYQGESVIAWGGVMLTAGPVMMMISWLMMFKSVARTSARFPLLNLLGAVGTGLAVWSWLGQGGSVLPAVLALVGWAGFIMYAYWYSSFGRKASHKLKLGAVLPSFTLKDVKGALVSSTKLADKPTVLISPQPHSNTVSLAKKLGVDFDFLTDEGNAAARALGINVAFGLPLGMQMMGYNSETVLPTVVITDKSGKVLWAHETDNYRIRPEPDVYLDVLRHNGMLSASA